LLRSVKYGLYGAVLAGVVGGTAAWQGVDKSVDLVVDGQPTAVHTTAHTVAGALSSAGYRVGPHDLVAPAPSAHIHSGSHVVLNRGRLLRLDVNGVRKDIWTTAPTVAAAMDQLGYSTANFTSVSRSRRLPLTPTSLTIRTPRLVTIVHDGTRDRIATTDNTVGELLADLGVTVSAKNQVSPRPSTMLRAGMTIRVRHVAKKVVTSTRVVPFATTRTVSKTIPAGTTKVVRAGRTGLSRVTFSFVYIDGKLVGKTLIKTVVLRKPVTQVVRVGASTTAAPSVAVAPGTAQDIARQMLLARGWGTSEFNCLATLWGHESGWRTNAGTPSGAYGIPQAVPGTKMAVAGADWLTSARTQITWGLSYISGRYGTPCGAWSAWQAQGGWY
jgi:uncharacterized protein YabE (DUF348 family)